MSLPDAQQLPPGFEPEPGWALLDMPRRFGEGRSFVSGSLDDDRLRVYYYLRESDQALLAKVLFGFGAEGPPGHAHGGSMAAMLDEAMGFACWIAGHPVVAARITIEFKRQLPLERVLQVESYVSEARNGKVTSVGRIFDPETGDDYSTGEGLFIERPIEAFGNLARAAYIRRPKRDGGAAHAS